jgi:hypothetical protein
MTSPAKRAAIEEAAWALALRLPQFGYVEISTQLAIGAEFATAIVRGWVKAGLLDIVRDGHRVRRLWKVREGAERPLPKVARTPEDNLWTAMRKLRSFTARDLSAHATTDRVIAPMDLAHGYCRSLLAADYLRVERKSGPGGREAIYRLCRDTGPLPPRERRVRAVVDENTDETRVIGGAA